MLNRDQVQALKAPFPLEGALELTGIGAYSDARSGSTYPGQVGVPGHRPPRLYLGFPHTLDV